MLSVGRIGAGDGFRYLTDQVASQDTPRVGEELVAYYERTGYPPGVWVGAQAEAFGLSGAVDEEAMDHLFGRCADPRDSSQLGRRMYVYSTVEERVAARLGALGHVPSDEERLVAQAEEIAKGTPQAVSGFDLTFSAPKSVSVLFALGDSDTQAGIRAAHEAAWRRAYSYFETDVAATRVGAAGVAQVDVEGLTAAAFEHWYSRAGDPQLHTHVATSVMVRATDGRWRRIDSRALYRAAAATGERYTAELLSEVTSRLGVGWTHRKSGRSDTLVPEIAGVSDALIQGFSRRSVAINDGLGKLVNDYRAAHGYAPDRATLAALAQQATLASRPAGAHHSLADSRAAWAAEAAAILHCDPDQVTQRLLRRVNAAERDSDRLRPLRKSKLNHQARLTLARLEETGATWSGWDLCRAATAQLREAGFVANASAIKTLVAAVTRLPSTVEVGAPAAGGAGAEPVPEPPASLRRADGSSIFERRGERRYTSTRILEAEADLVALAQIRRMAPRELARRGASGFGDVPDDVLVTILAQAKAQVPLLADRVLTAQRDAANAQDALALANAALAEHRADTGPALRLVRERHSAEQADLQRLAELDDAAARRGFLPGSRVERAAAEATRAALVGQHPHLAESAATRARRFELDRATADRADQLSREKVLSTRGNAEAALATATGADRLARAQLREQSQAVSAAGAELARRQANPRRVNMAAYLDGLGPDQAGAVVRLADPSRPLDALIGPAGSGKTIALGRLVSAFVAHGRGVHVLAPTAVAAQGLGEAVGAPYATLHSALGAWRIGNDLPAQGDLVLIDEASMATTPMLADAATLASAQGALVRLIGDPRQLKAVGAGGGLDLVSDATAAPELAELRRFSHPWEAAATLGLRRGDSGALDAYFAHERVLPALDAVALTEVSDAWWDSPAGRSGTVMVASDNANVRALNLLARNARIEAGEVDPGGAELHDTTVAGVGDLVTTRRNERILATRANPGPGAYVRNHDRWVVRDVGADGSLSVVHIERGEQVTLPASYVAQHVELAYADTGHAVQGRTVQRAEVLVRPSDTRTYLYVAMSRARQRSTAHVVTDELQDEAAGYHPVRGARDVLEAVLARDEAVSAKDWARAAEAAHTDPALIADQYRTAAAEELRARLATALGGSAALLGEDGWRVVAAAASAEAAGLDAGAIVAHTASAEAPALVEALDHARFAGADPLGKARSVAPLADVLPAPGVQVAPDVAAWQGALAQRLEHWRTDLAGRLAAGEAPKPWAAALGAAPGDPEARVAWADAVAHVALYRATHHVEGDSLLGPEVALGTPASAARMRATRASLAAQELGRQVSPQKPAGDPRLVAAQNVPGLRVIPPESRPGPPKPPPLRR